jgi:hypothetical protein
MSFFNLLKPKRGSTAKILVPKLNYQESLKRYINLLDNLSDANKDFQQIAESFLSTLNKEAQEKLPKFDFGSSHDAYALINYMNAVFNALHLHIRTSIQQEYTVRAQILEQDNLYHELTTLTLTDDQHASLLAFEQIHKDDFISKATTSRKENIVAGNSSAKEIMESEHDNQDTLLQKEADKLILAKTRNTNFKDISYSLSKTHYQRKIKEHQDLNPVYFDNLQESIAKAKGLVNGEFIGEQDKSNISTQ